MHNLNNSNLLNEEFRKNSDQICFDSTYKNIILNNTPILAGSGYTAMHLACLNREWSTLDHLINGYHMNVNDVAADGVQPIHIACLSQYTSNVDSLLEAGANVEAEITKEMYLNYKKINCPSFNHLNQTEWCDDFGDKMSLLTFVITVMHNTTLLASILLKYRANFKIRGRTNKTLLMYAFEKNRPIGDSLITLNSGDENFINAQDNDGYSAIHYLLHSDKPERFWLNEEHAEDITWNTLDTISTLMTLVISGADIYATPKKDPSSFPLNIAAYRYSYRVIEYLLPKYASLSKSYALRYALVYPQDFTQYIPVNLWPFLPEEQRKSIILIVKDLISRLTFGFQVNAEEKQLMEWLIAENHDVKCMANTYKEKVIEEKLKAEVIHYDDKSLTYYDIMSLNNKKFQLLVRKRIFVYAHFTSLKKSRDTLYFNSLFHARVNQAYRRFELLRELKKVEQLRKAIPLPYELVLDITEYLENDEFENFIQAFQKFYFAL